MKIREDLAQAQSRAWGRLGKPGTWLDAKARIQVAEETRHASDGKHDSLGRLPDSWIEVIHRIVSDPGRLTHGWYKKAIASGVAETEYVEIVSVIAHVTALDTFAHALGLPRRPLPAPRDGEPSRYRPREAHHSDAWVPTLAWGKAAPPELDLVSGGPLSNIRRALTLVPDEVRSFFDLCVHQYQSGPQMYDFSREYRAITHAQIELVAARVSALNRCTY